MIKKKTVCDVSRRSRFCHDMHSHVLVQAVLLIVALWGLGSLVGVSARCDPRELLQSDGRCSGQVSRLALC